jgi:hypothetical protein
MGISISSSLMTSQSVDRAANSGRPAVRLFVTSGPGKTTALVIKGISGQRPDQPFELRARTLANLVRVGDAG